MTLTAILLIFAGGYVGWNIGANDASNCIGTSVGSGILTYKRAILLVSIFVVIGAVLQGHNVMKTIGKGIVMVELPSLAIFVALFSAGIFVTLATFFKVPVSTSQSVVGGVLGVGIGAFGFESGHIKFTVLGKIVLAWTLCPVITLILSFIIYAALTYFLRRRKKLILWDKTLSFTVILSACYVSYSLGANDVGNAMGPLLNKYPDMGLWLALLGGIALSFGAISFGSRVTYTIGKGITPLDLPGAFAAQFAGAFGVHLFTILGIPVSTSQAIVGAVAGVGLVKGFRAVKGRQMIQIAVGWVLTPSCAAIFSFFTYRLLSSIL